MERGKEYERKKIGRQKRHSSRFKNAVCFFQKGNLWGKKNNGEKKKMPECECFDFVVDFN